ncbi:MAG: PD40 domain-containing protein [Bryobacterales bacterium]|nr:PD40 domain-containing protein [Bryobacterales bacterium]
MTLVSSAAAQIHLTELATTGDGSEAYFRSDLPLQSEAADAETVPGRIFRVGPDGFGLYQERQRMDPPPGLGLTNYFELVRATASGDGRIVAVAAAGQCSGSFCSTTNRYQTTITGLAGGPMEVEGVGTLSGNGRYLFVVQPKMPRTCAFVLDLQNPVAMPCTTRGVYPDFRSGRAVADDGTAVISDGALFLLRGAESTLLLALSGSVREAVIDAAGATIVYALQDWRTNRRSLRIYRLTEKQEEGLVSIPGADSYSPAISADGRRVLFVSTVSGAPQIHVVATNGDEAPRQVTYDNSGVLASTMSDDGKVAWYLSGSGRLYSVDLESGESRERLGRTPQVGSPPRMTPGSLYTLCGVGFSDAVHRARFFPLPRSLGGVSVTVNGVDAPLVSVSPTEIVLQAPSTPGGAPGMRVNTTGESPFRPATAFAALTGGPAFLRNPQSKTLAVHEDWSGLVVEDNPARPGEVIHLYGTGFGTVDRKPADGDPAPANPPARTLLPVTCTAYGADNRTLLQIPVLYSGLAPGLAGVFQLDMRVPGSNVRSDFGFACVGEGNSQDFYGSFPVEP